MKDVYVAVGHGRRDNGVFDPGALGDDGRYEHYEAAEVVAEVIEGLERSGLTFDHEDHGSGGPEDPNFSGSIRNVNAGSYRCAVEVHFDWAKAPEGGFGFWISDEGKKLADRVFSRWSRNGLDTRPEWHRERGNLAFLNRTKPPALLWECGRVRDFPRDVNELMGESIAAGICDYLGREYIPQSTKKHYKVVTVGDGPLDDLLAYLLGKRHAFKRVSPDEVGNYDIDFLIKVGHDAASRFNNRNGIVLAGGTRYETADIVLAKVLGPDADRTAPWKN